MTATSKTVGALSLISCLNDIHKTSLIYSQRAYQKASADTFISTSIGCQKTNTLSYKDSKRKNWLLSHNFLAAPCETIASIKGYLYGLKDGIVRYLPNLILAGLSIIPNKNHKILANASAAALGVIEVVDFITNATNASQRTNYLE